jgi:superfamily II DNA or RNA helicase
VIPRPIVALFDSSIRARGEAYASSDRVHLWEVTPQRIVAEVRGTTRYQVAIARQGSTLRLGCSCPFAADQGTCKHLWAVLVTAARVAELEPLLGAPSTVHFGMPAGEGLVTGARPGQRGGRKDATQAPAATWKRVLARAGQARTADPERKPWPPCRRLAFLLDVHASLASTEGLVLRLATQAEHEGAADSPPRLLRGGFDTLGDLPDADDRLALQLLRGSARENDWSHARSSTSAGFIVAPEAFDSTIRVVAQGGRLWMLRDERAAPEGPLGWDDGASWEFQLRGERAADGLAVRGELVRPGEAMDLADPVILHARGLLVARGAIARWEARGNIALAASLRDAGEIPVTREEVPEFLERLHTLPRVPPLTLPPGLRVTESSPVPLRRLDIEYRRTNPWAPVRAGVRVAFDYDGIVVDPSTVSAAAFDRDRLRVVHRDLALEADALRRVRELGAREEHDYHEGKHRLVVARSRLDAMVERLASEGWRVTVEGAPQRRASGLRTRIASGTDWFDLDAVVEFGELSAPLPAVLAALSGGRRQVVLADGSVGQVTDEWRRRLAPLLAAAALAKDGRRFHRSQAGLLDALVAALPATDVDAQFTRVRAELREFEQVVPGTEPPGFAGTLRGYQREALGWFDFLRRFGLGGCLADDMGLGKTIQVLALLAARHDAGAGPSLVVVPRSLVFNWKEEAARFAPHLRLLDHSGPERSLAAVPDADLVITTYGTLRRDVPMLREVDFDYVILDEAQAIKNATTASAKAVRLLRARHRLALTGTPVENRLEELWSLVEFLNPGLLGSATVFRRLARASAPARSASKAAAADAGSRADVDAETTGAADPSRTLLARALRPIILRRTKAQVARELPERLEQTLTVELEPAQRRVYDELRDHYRHSLLPEVQSRGIGKSRMQVLEALLRLRQAACHPALIDRHATGAPSAKLDALLPMLAEVTSEGHRALVFSQFTSFLALLRTRLDAEGIRYEYLDGATRDRQARVAHFQSGDGPPVFLISLRAGGQGLNLTAADYVYLLDPWWNPAVEAQAIDRAHRIGQRQQVIATRLVAHDTVEEKILQLQRSKRELADAILSEDQGMLAGIGADEVALLFS